MALGLVSNLLVQCFHILWALGAAGGNYLHIRSKKMSLYMQNQSFQKYKITPSIAMAFLSLTTNKDVLGRVYICLSVARVV